MGPGSGSGSALSLDSTPFRISPLLPPRPYPGPASNPRLWAVKPHPFSSHPEGARNRASRAAAPTSSSRLSVPKEMRLLNSFSRSCRAWGGEVGKGLHFADYEVGVPSVIRAKRQLTCAF